MRFITGCRLFHSVNVLNTVLEDMEEMNDLDKKNDLEEMEEIKFSKFYLLAVCRVQVFESFLNPTLELAKLHQMAFPF